MSDPAPPPQEYRFINAEQEVRVRLEAELNNEAYQFWMAKTEARRLGILASDPDLTAEQRSAREAERDEAAARRDGHKRRVDDLRTNLSRTAADDEGRRRNIIESMLADAERLHAGETAILEYLRRVNTNGDQDARIADTERNLKGYDAHLKALNETWESEEPPAPAPAPAA